MVYKRISTQGLNPAQLPAQVDRLSASQFEHLELLVDGRADGAESMGHDALCDFVHGLSDEGFLALRAAVIARRQREVSTPQSLRPVLVEAPSAGLKVPRGYGL